MTKSIDEILAGLPARPKTCVQDSIARGEQTPLPGIQIDRWELLELVKVCRPKIRVSDTAIAVLRAHLSVLPKGQLDSAKLTMSYAQVAEILQRSGIECERRFRRGEQDLEAVGLIYRKLSPNKRRFPVRDGKGTVVDAFGIDLAPLLQAVPELRAMRDEIAEEQARKEALKTSIRCQLHAAREAAVSIFGSLPDRLADLTALVTRIFRRKTVSMRELNDIAREVEEVSQVPADAAPCEQIDAAPDDNTSEEFPVVNAKLASSVAWEKQRYQSDKSAVAAGQNSRRIESVRKEINTTHARAEGSMSNTWQSCPSISNLYPDEPRSEHELNARILEFSGFLGLRQPQALGVLKEWGASNMLTALDYVSSRIDQIAKPAGYITTMLEKWQSGEVVAAGRIKSRLC